LIALHHVFVRRRLVARGRIGRGGAGDAEGRFRVPRKYGRAHSKLLSPTRLHAGSWLKNGSACKFFQEETKTNARRI
jgi:hypothetical protein